MTITRHGVPFAVVVRPDVLAYRRAEQEFERANRVGAVREGRAGSTYPVRYHEPAS